MTVWDLAIADNGDLIISGHGDLLGRSGIDLIEQRMRVRLIVPRGGWTFDRDGRFGSNLTKLIGMKPDDAQIAVGAFVNEALRTMDEINVTSADVILSDHDMIVSVRYRLTNVEGTPMAPTERVISISLPVSVGINTGLGD